MSDRTSSHPGLGAVSTTLIAGVQLIDRARAAVRLREADAEAASRQASSRLRRRAVRRLLDDPAHGDDVLGEAVSAPGAGNAPSSVRKAGRSP